MQITRLLETLGKLNIYLQVHGNELKIKGSKQNITPEIVNNIRAHKAELISCLQSNGLAGHAPGVIPVVETTASAFYPLSSAQRRLWVMSQVEGSGIAYNIPGTYVFEGRVDVDALTRAFQKLIARHESLRTVFIEDKQGEVKQFVLPFMPFSIDYHDLQQQQAPEETVKALVQSVITSAFNLVTGPLLRASLFRLTETKWVFTYVMHHIISDGWSMGVLIKELLLLYNAAISGVEYTLEPLRIQYKDYATWQQQQLGGASLHDHKAWWLQQFEGNVPVLELPADNIRPLIKTYNGRIINRRLDATLTASLKAICRQQDATLFMGLLAGVNALLHCYTGQYDIVIGSPIAGRDHPDLEGQIGFYVNTLALRTRFKQQGNFMELLADTRQTTLQAYEHQAYPFDELVNELNLRRDMSRHPLFDVMVVLQNAGGIAGEEELPGGLTVQEYKETESLGSKFDWLFIFTETGNEIQASIEYNTDIYHERTIVQAWTHLEQLLQAIAAQPSTPIQELDYLGTAEKNKLLLEFNDTAAEYPNHKTVHELFEEQVKATPHHIAIVCSDTMLTYAELNQRANRLSRFIKTRYAIRAGEFVALQLPRSEQAIVAMLAILKAGGAYIPIDTEYPEERVNFILEDSNCRIVINKKELELFDSLSSTFDREDPQPASAPDDLAYVIYTSGSTGMPKGVMIEHASIVRLVKNTNYVSLSQADRILSLSNFVFDGSTFDIYGALLNGSTLVIPEKDALVDAEAVDTLIKANKVTVFFLTTALLNTFIDSGVMDFEGVRHIFFGGELVSVSHVKKFISKYPSVNLVHVYGPTENTTFSSFYPVAGVEEEQNTIPIGKAIANSECYILSANNRLTPVGVTGEICVAGDGLARGYLNRPGLTAEKFVPNPFRKGQRMYRTGDLGRWLPDGSIVFAGRIDDQVKIRGYRIEPGEIQAVIQAHPAVESTIVIARTRPDGEKELVAYMVVKQEVSSQDIRAYAGRELPDYMVPAHFVQLDELPLTQNGKVDKQKLPEPGEMVMGNDVACVPPRNETEEKLVLIWQEILGKERVGIKDDFFLSGGHSLKLTRLSSQLQKIFEVKVTLKQLFSHPVLEQQAELIRQAAKTKYLTITPVPVQEHYPLSAAQRRLWILSQFRQSNIAYNIPSVYVFEGRVDTNALEYAFSSLIERHESLRTVFRQDESGEVRQYIQATVSSRSIITYHDVRQSAQPEQQVKELVQQEAGRPFDLEAGPLLRATLYQLGDHKWVFMYVMHHIVSDAWSMDILMNELLLFYNARLEERLRSLPPLRIHYKDYAAWQHAQLSGEGLLEHKSYWVKQFEGELPVLNLPGARPRPALKTFSGGMIHKRIPVNISEAIKAICLDEGSTLFMGLLAAVNALLYSYTRQEDIIIGTPIAGREHADLEDQIGCYINTLALRTRFNGHDSFRKLLSHTKEVTLGAYEHQAYPFDELVEQLHLHRDAGRSALFDVMVVLQNTGSSAPPENPRDLQVSAYPGTENLTSAFDLTFNFIEINGEISVSIEYNSDLFSKLSALRMAGHLEQLLETFTQHPTMPLNQFTFLTDTRKNKLPGTSAERATTQSNKKTELIDDLEL